MDGSAVARALLGEVRRAVALLRERGIAPQLSVLLVGDDPASQVYVRHKIKACLETGIDSDQHLLSAATPAAEVYRLLEKLSHDPDIYGVLLQLPVPDHVDSIRAIDAIAADHDVDGFHPANLGRLMAWRGTVEPCTPRGVMTLLRAYEVPCRGKRAVVIGRSIGVGRPMAQMLVRADATVTVCHRHTVDLRREVESADIVVVATGVPHLVKGAWIKDGAVVVDVGITRNEEGGLVGDVEFDAAYGRAALVTPVPGGVGPMTVATLMENTVRAACARHGLRIDQRGVRALEEA